MSFCRGDGLSDGLGLSCGCISFIWRGLGVRASLGMCSLVEGSFVGSLG